MKKIKSPHLEVRPGWLKKLKEEPLLPNLSIIDPHHHLWDVGFGKYYVEELLKENGFLLHLKQVARLKDLIATGF